MTDELVTVIPWGLVFQVIKWIKELNSQKGKQEFEIQIDFPDIESLLSLIQIYQGTGLKLFRMCCGRSGQLGISPVSPPKSWAVTVKKNKSAS